jgi:hypothetical protein
LEGDFTRKKGQIAHIDQDSSNPDESNLVYLCFEHHDEYDSSTSQSKGITQAELRESKKSLLAAISKGEHTLFDKPVQDICTAQEFKNDNSGVQVNIGNTAIGHQNVYNQQALEFFDEVKNGVRTTYRRNPVTGALIVVAMSLA